MDADELFARAQALRSGIEKARRADDLAEVERLESALAALRETAAKAAFDVPRAQDELIRLRHDLRKLVLANKAARTDYLGTGSPERQRFEWPTLSNRPFYDDDYERLAARIRELEVGLVAADAMGDVPLLDPTNETKWW